MYVCVLTSQVWVLATSPKIGAQWTPCSPSLTNTTIFAPTIVTSQSHTSHPPQLPKSILTFQLKPHSRDVLHEVQPKVIILEVPLEAAYQVTHVHLGAQQGPHHVVEGVVWEHVLGVGVTFCLQQLEQGM